jgi:hypothetical protein
VTPIVGFAVGVTPIVGFAVAGDTGIAGAGEDTGIDDDAGIGEDCADAMLVDASASAAVASMSRLDCCMRGLL